MLQGGFGGFFAVKDGDAVIHFGSPEPVVRGAVTNDVLAGDVRSVVVQRGVEGVFTADLSDVPHRHVGAGEELFFRRNLIVGSQVSTNSSFMGLCRVVTSVRSGARHTIDRTSNLVKVTISTDNEWLVMRSGCIPIVGLGGVHTLDLAPNLVKVTISTGGVTRRERRENFKTVQQIHI